MTDGTSRAGRMPYALEPGYVLPQERPLHAELVLLSRLAAHVPLAGAGGAAGHTWAGLFEREPAVAMAELLSIDITAEREAFAALMARDPTAAIGRLAARSADLRRIATMLREGGVDDLARQIEQADDGLGAADLAEILASGPRLDAPALLADLAGRSGIDIEGRDPADRAHRAVSLLTTAHEAVLAGLQAARPGLERRFAARLSSGEIEPALGLLIAQLRLLDHGKRAINGFSDRHTRFYYQDVLGATRRAARPPDSVLRLTAAGAPVSLDADTALLAQSGGGTSTPWSLVDPVTVHPGDVGAVRILRYRRDRAISRQALLGYVTSIESFDRPPRMDEGAAGPFGGATTRTDAAAAIGLDIASNAFLAAEGRRDFTVELRFRRRVAVASEPSPTAITDASDQPTPRLLAGPNRPAIGSARHRRWLHHIAEAHGPAEIRAAYGALVAETLVDGLDWPGPDVQAAMLRAIAGAEGPDASPHDGDDRDDPFPHGAAQMAAEWFARRPVEVFQDFLHRAFHVTLSGPDGDMAVSTARTQPGTASGEPGFRLRVVLDEAAPAVVPPPGAPAPVMRISLTGGSLFCPVSLFDQYELNEIGIDCAVKGLTRLTAFSDEGPLDPSRPFLPFGAQPRDGSVLLVGARELAVKSVRNVGLRLDWADLPQGAGGFAEYHRDYGPDFPAPAPELALSYLTTEGWAEDPGGSGPLALSQAGHAGLMSARHMQIRVSGRAPVARAGTSEADFRQRNAIRAGLARLQLRCPAPSFGHAVYPGVLARSMRPSRIPFRTQGVPPQPHTPKIASLRLDYAASETIALAAPDSARPDQSVRRRGPFGTRTLFPRARDGDLSLVPGRLADGCVFLRLDTVTRPGRVSLAFDMGDDSHRRLSFPPQATRWFYLSSAGWRALPGTAIEADSTEGMMRSGIVRLRVPSDAAHGSEEMPGDGIWIATGTDRHLDAFPRLRAVWLNGARARQQTQDGAPPAAAPDTWTLAKTRPGITGIAAIGAPFGGAPAETERTHRIRVSERLHHRNRGVTAWDLERLVLEAFPQVWKAKCLPATDRRNRPGGGPDGGPVPGAVSLVVVPAPPGDARERPAQPRFFDVLTLRHMAETLRPHCAAFADLDVSNPAYDWIQLRARILAEPGQDEGALVHRIQRLVGHRLSVWTAPAPMGGFGWSVSLRDIGAFILGQPGVARISEISLVKLERHDDGTWRLHDTARAGPTDRSELLASHPWSLPVPLPEHRILATRQALAAPPAPAGIGSLGVGQTMVIGQSAP